MLKQDDQTTVNTKQLTL